MASGGRRILACVLAYNRAHLLTEVLAALVEQVDPSDVLVVDNGSIDSTPEVVRSFPGVRSFRLEQNVGGSGGFAWTIELAVALGYDALYLLDDDAIPRADSVATLNAAADDLFDDEGFAFLVSEPVADAADREAVGLPVPAKSWKRHRAALRHNGIGVDYAAFLGILIDLRVAAEEALPYSEFFIWCDDLEYTRRIARVRGAACLPASKVVHESQQMEAANERRSLGWKFFYLVRNRLWLARWALPASDTGHRMASIAIAVQATRNELAAQRFRNGVIRTALKAWAEGLLTPRPAPHPVGSLLTASPEARDWVARQGAA